MKPRQLIKKQGHYFDKKKKKGQYSQGYDIPSGHV